MDEATPETVLGDFSLADEGFRVALDHSTGTAKFNRVGDEFWVRTTGPSGEDEDFRIRYVFGVAPLQQYLVEFPGGALQCLDLAWDSDKKEWFDLTPDEPNGVADPLHWTGLYQRWNTMCAECHSTNLDKKLNVVSGEYKTDWLEIDVGCQACHGDGAGHLAWMEDGADKETKGAGFARPVERGVVESQIEACAPCHSRRTPLYPLDKEGSFFDKYEPATLRPDLYHPDGQIMEEVYVYGSYVQSKMYAKGVACTECHDPHTARLVLEGNALCMQCHTSLAPTERFPTLQKKEYDTPEHHFHAEGSEGAKCINCHMIERTYMRIDERRDHSFRIPRPDISVDLGTPNACNDCHDDKDFAWAAAKFEEWWGQREEKRPHFAYPFYGATVGDPRVFPWLQEIVTDKESPAIVRATALEFLEPFGPAALDTLTWALDDEDPFVRTIAARSLITAPLQQRVSPLLQLLNDPIRSVRIQAGRSLAELKAQSILPERERELLDSVLAEYREAQEYSCDLPGPHLNLGRMYEEMGRREKAILEYRTALALDPWFLQAAFNLTALLNRLGRNAEAEAILKDSIQRFPEEGELHYSLGLLQAELKRMSEAASTLAEAARLAPTNPRIEYNRGLVLRELKRDGDAENALLAAYRIDPGDPRTAHALALLYRDTGDLDAARKFAEELTRLNPQEQAYKDLLNELNGQ